MKPLLLIILMLAACFETAHAQQAVSQTVDGGYRYVAIDNRRMPAKTRKTATEVNSTIDTTTGHVVNHTEGGDMNKKVSPFFLISPVEMLAADGTAATTGNGLEWEPASDACKNYKGLSGNDAGKWRLPTLREAELMWILRPKITNLGYMFRNVLYWTSTENSGSPTSAWLIDFYAGNTNTSEKTVTLLSTRYVRCVRDYSLP